MPVGQINWFVSYACAVFMFFYFVLEEFQQERLVALFRRRGAVLIPAQLGVVLVRIFGGLLVLSGMGLFAWQWRNRGVEYYVHRKMTD